MTPSARRPHVCLATCAALPDLDDDERLIVGPLEAAGARVSPAIWDDPSVDWGAFDLVVIRSTWDYTARRGQFVAWARSVPRLANPAEVIAWNTDKRYLAELEAAGLPVVPTRWLEPGDPIALPGAGLHVVKPSIGAGSVGAERFDFDDRAEALRAHGHAARLLGAGLTVMVQPYVPSVDREGETGVVLLRGAYSHAITKSAMLGAPRQAVAGLYKSETIDPRRPSPAELGLANQAMGALRFAADSLLYARVDMLADEFGRPMIIELELTEPSLFLATAPGSAERFAQAILAGI